MPLLDTSRVVRVVSLMLPPSLMPVAAVNAALKLASGKLAELSVTAAWAWLQHIDASSTAAHNLKNRNRLIVLRFY